jgi:hypothetical protein
MRWPAFVRGSIVGMPPQLHICQAIFSPIFLLDVPATASRSPRSPRSPRHLLFFWGTSRIVNACDPTIVASSGETDGKSRRIPTTSRRMHLHGARGRRCRLQGHTNRHGQRLAQARRSPPRSRFHPPATGWRPSGISRSAELVTPLSSNRRSPQVTSAKAGAALESSAKPRCSV